MGITLVYGSLLMVLTTVDRVSLNFGKPAAKGLAPMTVAQAKRWMEEGQFPSGSMGPKMQGAIEFLESSTTDTRVIIGPLDRATEAILHLLDR